MIASEAVSPSLGRAGLKCITARGSRLSGAFVCENDYDHASAHARLALWESVGPLALRGACRAAHRAISQPHYTLCTLQRERRPDRPSIYRLLSEHDGRLMLVAQQPAPGEDFLLFS